MMSPTAVTSLPELPEIESSLFHLSRDMTCLGLASPQIEDLGN